MAELRGREDGGRRREASEGNSTGDSDLGGLLRKRKGVAPKDVIGRLRAFSVANNGVAPPLEVVSGAAVWCADKGTNSRSFTN